MAERKLIVVTDAFEISGRCTCLVPVVPYELMESGPGGPLKAGDQLELRKPDGTTSKVKIRGLGWPSPAKGGLFIQLEASITKSDVPPGTEVWKTEEPIDLHARR